MRERYALNVSLPFGHNLPQLLEAEDAAVPQCQFRRLVEDLVDGRLQSLDRQRSRVRDAAAQVDG